MKTKTLLIAAAALAVGVISSQAQVYSQNIVGYVNVSVPTGAYQIISNPLDAPTNTLNYLIPNPPPGSLFYKYTTGSGYTIYTFDEFDLVWLPNGNASLSPGQAGFLKLPTGVTYTNTFVGNALTGSLTNSIPAGYAQVSSKLAIGGSITNLSYPASPGDLVYKYTPGSGYTIYTFDEFDLVWLPSVPSFNVGEGFFSFKTAPANWIQNYNP